jgi:hypothetical protein
MGLTATLQGFAEKCNQHERLRVMNRAWTRNVRVLAEDVGQDYWIRSVAGELSAGEGELSEDADMEIRADQRVLEAVFSGEMTPTEPYNQGDLMVRGNQDDLFRLDVITLMIWGE